MIELLTTPKTAIIFAVVAAIVLDAILTTFLHVSGLPWIAAGAFCTPLSVVVIAGLMGAGAVVFHAHKQITS